MMATLPRAALVECVARATARYPFRVWGFGESIAMEGLLAAGGEPGRMASRLIEHWDRSVGSLLENRLAHVAPGVPLVMLFEQTADRSLLDRALELAHVLDGTASGAHGARIHRPDLPGWQHQVWVDCMHLDGPFLARLARVTGDRSWGALAAELLLSHARVLQDERSGLFFHGFDDSTGRVNSVYWGRGQGWALLGLVDTASPSTELRQRLQALVQELDRTGEDGRWHTVVDRPDTSLESSVSAFVALGLRRALKRGLVSSPWQILADSSWQAVIRQLSPSGELLEVSDATPVGSDAAHYQARGRGVFPWGQGPALLAILEQEGCAGQPKNSEVEHD
ncbi:MAG: glycoside hydrolase family 88 protein [Chloroflexota bacterium]